MGDGTPRHPNYIVLSLCRPLLSVAPNFHRHHHPVCAHPGLCNCFNPLSSMRFSITFHFFLVLHPSFAKETIRTQSNEREREHDGGGELFTESALRAKESIAPRNLRSLHGSRPSTDSHRRRSASRNTRMPPPRPSFAGEQTRGDALSKHAARDYAPREARVSASITRIHVCQTEG